jgi:DNA-binding NarL/FixJ family response regulator
LIRYIRVLLVDDFSPFRDFLRTTIEQMPNFAVVGEAADGIEAVEKTQELAPDLILLDIGLPKLSGIEVARQIQQSSHQAKILMVTGICDWDTIEHSFLNGAGGYLLKADAAAELRPAVDLVLMGAQFLSSTAIRHILDECKHGGPAPFLHRISGAIAKQAEDDEPGE